MLQVAMLCVLYCICACSTKMGGLYSPQRKKIIKPDTRGWSFVMCSFCQTSTSPTLPVRPKRGKVVVFVVLLLGTVRYESKYRPIIHFRCFTDPHNHTYSESSRQVLSTDAPVMTMTKTHAKTKTKTKTELSRRRND